MKKVNVEDLAILGGPPLFEHVRSTSNLVQPDENKFFDYLSLSFDDGKLHNGGVLSSMLEDRLSEIHNVKHCITFCNGLWALVMSMKLLALSGKTEVIMPSLTYRRMADIAAWVGLIPRFCEVDRDTLAMNEATVFECINENTALILAAHPIINLCDIDGIVQLAETHKIPLLFDSVEAAFSSHDQKMLGGFGEAECYSMHASKFLNGFEGGYVTTNDDDFAQSIRLAKNGRKLDEINTVGLNLSLNEMHSAMTLASIDDANAQVKRNKHKFKEYKKQLARVNGVRLIEYNEQDVRTYKNAVVELTEKWPFTRKDTIEILQAENMLVRGYYSPALHMKITTYKTIAKNLVLTENLSECFLNLPSGDFLLFEDIKIIADFLDFILNHYNEINDSIRA